MLALTLLFVSLRSISPDDVLSYEALVAAISISIPLALAGCLQIWSRRARYRVYRALKRSTSGRVQVQIRVMTLASIGMLIGVICTAVLIREIGQMG
jgi:hypothetical protein